MAKFVWSGAQDTNWFNPNNWDPAIVPPAGATVTIPAGLANYPAIGDGNTITLGATINIAGQLYVNSTGDNTNLQLQSGGNDVLSGGGAIILSDNANNRIYGVQSGTVLDNVNDTIEGAGQISSNGALSILNQTQGVINADAAVNALVVTGISITNNGLVESTSTGGLDLGGVTLDQSGGGTLSAAGGNIYVNNSTIRGGSINGSGGGLDGDVETNGNGTYLDGAGTLPVTIAASGTVLVNDGTNLTIAGVIANSGVILLDSGEDGVHFDNTDLIVNGGGVTKLQGAGTLKMSDSGANRIYSNQSGTTLENVDDTITGAGQIYSNNNLTLQNDASGVINASAATNALSIFNITVNNSGLVEATSTGGLGLGSMTLNQTTGGTLSAAGGNVYVNNSNIVGGTLKTLGSSLIETNGDGTQLTGTGGNAVTLTQNSTVQVNDGQNLTIVGVINDVGTILLDSGEDGIHFDNTDLIVNSSAVVKLQGAGTLQMSDSGANRIYSNQSGTTLENVDDTITGAGQIYSNGNLTLQNDAAGVINASTAINALDINSITVSNAGLIESTSTGGLILSGMTLNQTGAGALSAAGGNVYINNTSIVGGTLESSGMAVLETNGNGTTLNGSGSAVSITKNSTVQVNDGQNLTIVGTISDVGTILLDSGEDGVHYDNTDLIVNSGADVKLQGGGTLQLSNSGANRIYSNNSGTTLENVDDTITGAGQIFSNGNLTLQNDASGVINASAATSSLLIQSITVNNSGLLESTSTGGLVIQGATLNQAGGGKLSAAGGNVYFSGDNIEGGTLQSSGGGVLETNGNGTLLNGTSSTLTITSGSTVQVNDGQNLTLAGVISNSGTILLDSGQNGVNFDNTDLLINGAVTLNGSGTISLSSSGANRIYSNTGSSTLDNVDDKISGAGQIFSNGNLSITNEASGIINASSFFNALSIGSIQITNKGLIESTSLGGLDLNGGSNIVQSGAGKVSAAFGNVYVNNNTISGGAVASSGPYLVETDGNGALLSGASSALTITAGSNVWVNDGQNLSLTGSIVDAGAISLNSGEDGVHFDNTDLLIDGTVTLSGGGVLQLSNSGNNRIYSNQGGSTLINDDTIVGAGQIFSNGNMSLQNGVSGIIEAGQGETLTIGMGLSNAGVLEGNGGLLDVQGAVTGAGIASVMNNGTVRFDSGSVSLNVVDYLGPDAGNIILPGGVTPTILGWGAGDTLTLDYNLGNTIGVSDTFVEDGSKTFGTLTINEIVGGNTVAIESFRVNGDYTASDFSAFNTGTQIGVTGLGDSWNGATAAWATPGDWSQGTPGADDDVYVASGSPTLSNTAIGTVRSMWVASGATVNFSKSTGTVTNEVLVQGVFALDKNAGQGGSTVSVGSVVTSAGGSLVVGNSTLAAKDQLTAIGVSNSGSISVIGSATKQALLDVTGPAGFGTAGAVMGTVSLAGDSAIEFGSGTINTIATGGSLTLTGTTAYLELASKLNQNSALAALSNVQGQLHLDNGAVIAPTGSVYVSGSLGLDDANGAGGTSLTLNALYNLGVVTIGNATLSSADKLVVGSIRNTGTLNLVGSASQQALFDSTGAANFGSPNLLTGTVSLTGDSAVEFASGQFTAIAAGAALHESGASAFVEDATKLGSNSALKQLATVAGALTLDQGATIADTVALAITGSVTIDGSSPTGGSSLTTTAGLSNSGTLSIGQNALGAADLVEAASLSNTGTITLTGSATQQALLDIGSDAGFGADTVLTGAVSLSGDSAIEFATGSIQTIAGGSSLTLSGAKAYIENATKLNQNSALASLTTVSGALNLDSQVTISSTSPITVGGSLSEDAVGGNGGSSLTTTGQLTNTGTITLGNSTLNASDLIKASALSNTGNINLAGNGANQALMNIGSTAGFGTAGVLTGNVSLSGDSAIEFTGGSVATILSGSMLTLQGPSAYLETSSSPGQNSALTSLATISGQLNMHNGAAISTTKALTVSTGGVLDIDATGGDGGSSLTSSAALTNNGSLTLGNATLSSSDGVTATSINNTGGVLTLIGNGTAQALLHATTSAAGFGTASTVLGSVSLTNDSAIEFASGSISTIASGASLSMSGSNAYIEATATNSNSALTGLNTVAGTLSISNGVKIASTKAITNTGSISLDGASGAGGTSLTTTAALNNNGSLTIGNAGITGNDLVQATALNSNTSLTLNGSATASSLLNLTAGTGLGATSTSTGSIYIGQNSAIELKSAATITTIASGAKLELGATNAYLEDAGSLGSNSALTKLATIAGSLFLDAASTVSTTAAINNTGSITLDGTQSGGASLSTTLGLTNSGTITAGSGGNTSAPITISAKSISNTGTLTLDGGPVNGVNMSVGSTAEFSSTAGTVTGTVNVDGNSHINFASGGIKTIVSGATLRLNGIGSGLTVTGLTGSDSALNTLTSVAGQLDLDNGAGISAQSSLTITGSVLLDSGNGSAGSGLSDAATITNSGTLNLGNTNENGVTGVSAVSIVNNDFINLTGNGGRANAELSASNKFTNNGDVFLISDSETMAGTVAGTGGFDLWNGSTLTLNGAVGANQTVTYDTPGAVNLGQASSFAGDFISFGGSDTIDATNLLWGMGDTWQFNPNGGGTGGTLDLFQGGATPVAALNFTGTYTNSSFNVVSDQSGKGALISFV